MTRGKYYNRTNNCDRCKVEKLYPKQYIFPIEEIIIRTGISIVKDNPCGWYEKYRITDEDELKKANEIWQKIKNLLKQEM